MQIKTLLQSEKHELMLLFLRPNWFYVSWKEKNSCKEHEITSMKLFSNYCCYVKLPLHRNFLLITQFYFLYIIECQQSYFRRFSGKSFFRPLTFDPGTNTQTIFFCTTLLSVEGIKTRFYVFYLSNLYRRRTVSFHNFYLL